MHLNTVHFLPHLFCALTIFLSLGLKLTFLVLDVFIEFMEFIGPYEITLRSSSWCSFFFSFSLSLSFSLRPWDITIPTSDRWWCCSGGRPCLSWWEVSVKLNLRGTQIDLSGIVWERQNFSDKCRRPNLRFSISPSFFSSLILCSTLPQLKHQLLTLLNELLCFVCPHTNCTTHNADKTIWKYTIVEREREREREKGQNSDRCH